MKSNILNFPLNNQPAPLSESDRLLLDYLRIDTDSQLSHEQRATAYLKWLQSVRAYGEGKQAI